MRRLSALLALAALASAVPGCASKSPAPVVDRSAPPPASQAPAAQAQAAATASAAPAAEGKGLYTVKKGDTLYGIALEHGQDYKDIVSWNAIENPNRIQVGQQLRVAPLESEAPVAVVRPIVTTAPVAARPAGGAASLNTDLFKREPKGGKVVYSDQALARLREPAPLPEQPAEKPLPQPVSLPSAPPAGEDAVDWAWPANGKTLAGFAESGAGGSKGIDIAGNTGDPVQAAGSGKVVYVGNGLRGYGNLVIVRHNAAFLSAYAYNSKILVKEGQAVARGQKIAEVGSSDTDQAKLHFEIRHLGKPVDPLKYLPAR